MLDADDLVDRPLIATFGPLPPDIARVIVDICTDAIAATVGPEIVEAISNDRGRLALVVPWVFDLARGLFVLHHNGPKQLGSSELLDILSSHQLSEHDRTRFAETVDLAATLTHDRVLEHVLGPGACDRDPRANAAAAPWLAALTYGHRLHIALELLRLLPAG